MLLYFTFDTSYHNIHTLLYKRSIRNYSQNNISIARTIFSNTKNNNLNFK